MNPLFRLAQIKILRAITALLYVVPPASVPDNQESFRPGPAGSVVFDDFNTLERTDTLVHSASRELNTEFEDISNLSWFSNLEAANDDKGIAGANLASVEIKDGKILRGAIDRRLPASYRHALVEILSDPIVALAIKEGRVDRISFVKGVDDNGSYAGADINKGVREIQFQISGKGINSLIYKTALVMRIVAEHEATHALNGKLWDSPNAALQAPGRVEASPQGTILRKLNTLCNAALGVEYAQKVDFFRDQIVADFEDSARDYRQKQNSSYYSPTPEERVQNEVVARLFERTAKAFRDHDPRMLTPVIDQSCASVDFHGIPLLLATPEESAIYQSARVGMTMNNKLESGTSSSIKSLLDCINDTHTYDALPGQKGRNIAGGHMRDNNTEAQSSEMVRVLWGTVEARMDCMSYMTPDERRVVTSYEKAIMELSLSTSPDLRDAMEQVAAQARDLGRSPQSQLLRMLVPTTQQVQFDMSR